MSNSPSTGTKPKISTVLQQTRDLQRVVARFTNELGTQGLALTNLTVKAKVGRSLSALVQAWGLLEESRLRLTKAANPVWDAIRAKSNGRDEDPDDAPPSTEPQAIEPSKESLSRDPVPTPTPGGGANESGVM